MNPIKIIIVLLFCGAVYYYLDDKDQEMQQQLTDLKQQVEVKDRQIVRQEQQTQDLVEQVAQQVNNSQQQQQKIDQQLSELNKVSQTLAEQQEQERENKLEDKKLRQLQKQRNEEDLRATYLSQGFQTMSMLKQQIVEFYMTNDRFPRNNKELKIARPQQFATDAIQSIWVSRGGRISVVYTEKSGIDRGTISLTPKVKNQQVDWKCTTKDFTNISHYFPQCQSL